MEKVFSEEGHLGVGEDRVQHILWRASNIDLPNSTQIVILQCFTNNTDHNKPSTFANEMMKIALVILKKSYQTKIIITSPVLWDNN